MFSSAFVFRGESSADHKLKSDRHSPNLIRSSVLRDLLVNYCHISEEFVSCLCAVCVCPVFCCDVRTRTSFCLCLFLGHLIVVGIVTATEWTVRSSNPDRDKRFLSSRKIAQTSSLCLPYNGYPAVKRTEREA